MLSASWLRGVAARLECAPTRGLCGPRTRRPRLEALEDRTAPAVLTVTKALDDGSAGTLRSAAVQASMDADAGTSDTIRFASGLAGTTIALTQGSLDLGGVHGTITIDGTTLSNHVRISGNDVSRVFQVLGGANVILSGLNVEHGNDGGEDGGGAILVYPDATLTVTGCTLAHNSATSNGGAIYNWFGTLTLTGSEFSANTSETSGGAIAAGGLLTVTDCTFSGNTSVFAGGAVASAANHGYPRE